MNIRTATTTGAVLAALVVSATPAVAAWSDQDGRDRRVERSDRVQPNKGGSNARGGSDSGRVSARQNQGASPVQVRRDVAVRPVAPRVEANARQNDARQYAPRQNDARPTVTRQYDTRQAAPRQNDARQNASRQYDARPSAPQQYDSRQYNNRQYDARRYGDRRYDARRYDNRRYDNHWYAYGAYGYRPYISRSNVFFGLGISIFAGRPYGFRFDYGWAPPYAYRFQMSSGIGYGGMSFLISPDDAAIFVDRQFIGIARDFDGQPVPLSAGLHEIELQAEGCQPVVFDVSVRPGQVIPYRGSLVAYR